MKRKLLSIILTLALCYCLGSPVLASSGIHVISGNPFASEYMSITNFIEEHILWEKSEGGLIGTLVIASAPATVTVLKDCGQFYYGDQFQLPWSQGSQVFKIEPDLGGYETLDEWEEMLSPHPEYVSRFVEVPLTTGERFIETDEDGIEYQRTPVGSTFVLSEGTYIVPSPWAALDLCIIVIGDGPPAPPTPSTPTPPTSNDIKVQVNGTAVSFDQPPIIQNGRTLVPLRAIFEALGTTVDYEQSTQTLTAVRESVTVIMQIGNSVFTVNGEQKTLDVAPQIIGGRTLVPARAIAESFGAEAAWDQSTQTMTITMG